MAAVLADQPAAPRQPRNAESRARRRPQQRRSHSIRGVAVGRRIWPFAALLAVLAGVSHGPSAALPQAARSAEARGQLRRRVAAVWIPSLAAAASGGPALAESTIQAIIAESRRKAKEDASKSIFNAYKTPTQNYNSSDLQSFLPTVFLTKRAFEDILEQMDNPRVNKSDPEFYEVLRQQNRVDPIRLIRKETFRTKMWMREKTGKSNAAEFEVERLKRALDEEDTQCLLISRTEGLVGPSAIRTTKRNLEALVDAIDQLLEVIPNEERETAKVISDTKTIPVLKLPLVDKYKNAGSKPAATGNDTGSET